MRYDRLLLTLAIGCVALLMYQFAGTPALWLGALGMATNVALGPLTDRVRSYELVRWEPDMRYTRTAGTVKNPSATALAAGGLIVGMPLKLVSTQWTIVLATDEANTGALFLGDDSASIPEALAQNAITQQAYPILVRGPALINKSVIVAKDPAGTAYTVATIVTALAALSPPIQTLVEPPAATTTTQTT
jgi:hypothetical protein